MLTIKTFLAAVDAYCSQSGIADATASSRIFNDGKRVMALRTGADIGTRRIERAMCWLSENWPDGGIWPADIPRPAPEDISEATE